MSNPPHWDDVDWGQVTLGSHTLPGEWEIEGQAERRIDVKTRKGSDGATIKDEGYENAEIDLIGRMITREAWEAMQGVLKEIHPRRKGAARDPLALVHPAAQALGITNVYVRSVTAPLLINGIIEIRITCLEWIPRPKPKPVRKAKPISKEDQRRANQRYSNEYIRGRVLEIDNESRTLRGLPPETKVDLGIPPPRDSALEFLETPTFVGQSAGEALSPF